VVSSIAFQEVGQRIHLIRGIRVMLDSDLASLYQVETKILNQAVKCNQDRFPADFMFQLTHEEVEISKVTNCDLRNRAWETHQISAFRFY
jgi:hypothetical protein